MSKGIDTIEFGSGGKTVTLDRDNLDIVDRAAKHPRRGADLEFDARIWDRVRDRVNALYDQVKDRARVGATVTLAFTIGRDADDQPAVKIMLKDGGKSETVWSSAEGGQLTLEGI